MILKVVQSKAGLFIRDYRKLKVAVVIIFVPNTDLNTEKNKWSHQGQIGVIFADRSRNILLMPYLHTKCTLSFSPG